MDYLWRDENRGCGYADARVKSNVHPFYNSLSLSRSHGRFPAVATGNAEPHDGRGHRARGGGSLMSFISLLFVAAVLLVSLTIYVLTGGADYGGGVWDLLATG